MKQLIALLLAVLMLLMLPACEKAGASARNETAEPAATSAGEPEGGREIAAASAAEVSLDGLETLEDVFEYLDSVLPYTEEELIPYAADIYHAGDSTLTFQLYGFCTRSGKIVTKPVFSEISVVRELPGDRPDPGNLYFCFIPSWGSIPVLYTLDGQRADGRRYEGLPWSDDYVSGGVGDVVDDGFYYLDGYTLDESGYAEFADHPDRRFDICRKSDGVKVAVTEAPCWPALIFNDLGNGDRLYYTLLDGVCTTWDKNFSPILQVPALGVHSVNLFSSASQQSGQEETDTANPAEQGDPFVLSDAQQYAANLSLSNFSEQWFCEIGPFDHYDAANTSVAQLFSFAHLWAKINRGSAIEYVRGYETMSYENFLDIVVPRLDYSDELVPHEGDDYSAALGMGNNGWDRCWYENGRFYYPAGDGESFNQFSVVDEAYAINDRTFRFRFTIYELDLDIYWERHGVPDEYYHLTPAEAAQRESRGEIHTDHTGTAVCTTVYWERSNREMYLLEYYKLDPRD